MSNSLNNSFSLRKGDFIVRVTFDDCERTWIQPVQYEDHQVFGKRIVLASNRSVLFSLKDDPDVKEVIPNKLFYISKKYIEDGEVKDVDVLYEVDSETNNVFRVSHLFIEYNNGECILLYNEIPKTYYNILRVIKEKYSDMVRGVFVKKDNIYIPFLSLQLP